MSGFPQFQAHKQTDLAGGGLKEGPLKTCLTELLSLRDFVLVFFSFSALFWWLFDRFKTVIRSVFSISGTRQMKAAGACVLCAGTSGWTLTVE